VSWIRNQRHRGPCESPRFVFDNSRLPTRDLAATHPEEVAELAERHRDWPARVGVITREEIARRMTK